MSSEVPPLSEVRSFIDADWRTSETTLPIVSPLDERHVVSVHQSTVTDVDAAVTAAAVTGPDWWNRTSCNRAAVLHKIADGIEAHADDLAAQMNAETGRPPAEAKGEVVRSISIMRISAEEATRISGELVPMDAVEAGAGKLGFTLLSPVGVVAAITPFNAPLNTICHKLGPALAGGNTVVLKPHHHGAGVAALIVEICIKAGLPAGCFQLVHGGPEIGRRLNTHPDVAFVNFTGSGAVAETIVPEIGLRRSLLELGGNAPTIVHRDADLERAARMCADAGFGLSGQSCISTQRIYVHEDVADEFTQRIVALAKDRSYQAGPDRPGGIGPLLTRQAAERVESWVKAATGQGATLVTGGRRDGTFMEPTVLADAPSDTQVVCDEIFGPVVVLARYSDLTDALAAANDSPWGLKAGLFTNSLDVGLAAAHELEFGTINVNAASRARVDQEPSGGIKQSGWGKEGPRYAIREMMNVRMVSLGV